MVLAGVVGALCLTVAVHDGIVARFDDPCRYCAGRRAIVVASRAGTPVPAPASGTVSFSGQVGGVHWVVVRSDDPSFVRVGLGGLRSRLVRTGDTVARGATLGATGERLIVSLRDGDDYRDPAPWWDAAGSGHGGRGVAAQPRSRVALVGRRVSPDSLTTSIHHCAVPTSWSLRRAEP